MRFFCILMKFMFFFLVCKALHDGHDVFFLLQVDGKYAYSKGYVLFLFRYCLLEVVRKDACQSLIIYDYLNYNYFYVYIPFGQGAFLWMMINCGFISHKNSRIILVLVWVFNLLQEKH